MSHVGVITDGVWFVNQTYWPLTIHNYSCSSNITFHTFCNSVQQVLWLLSKLCLHQSSSKDFQRQTFRFLLVLKLSVTQPQRFSANCAIQEGCLFTNITPFDNLPTYKLSTWATTKTSFFCFSIVLCVCVCVCIYRSVKQLWLIQLMGYTYNSIINNPNPVLVTYIWQYIQFFKFCLWDYFS
jgi:hypothetical protein